MLMPPAVRYGWQWQDTNKREGAQSVDIRNTLAPSTFTAKKVFKISNGYHKPKEVLDAEVAKCTILCANCHAEYHHLHHHFYIRHRRSPKIEIKNLVNPPLKWSQYRGTDGSGKVGVGHGSGKVGVGHGSGKVGHWTGEEHKRFLEGLRICGEGNWAKIAEEFVVTRTRIQVRDHAATHSKGWESRHGQYERPI
jgi:SHAQKYF class myb-like DNA-binding protein